MKNTASALGFALLAACGSTRCPNLAPELNYCLQAPGTGPYGTSLHEVVVKKDERFETLLVRTENDGAKLVVVGISPLGQTLVSAAWDGETVTSQPASSSRYAMA